jgi:uncharacterized protein Smg (DUF494 family)
VGAIKEFLDRWNMVEILQFLFATAKDQNLYFNQEGLVKELLNEHKFTAKEISEALEWFAPILQGGKDLDINPLAIRTISTWEEKYLPREIIRQILEWEQSKTISLIEREILLDRLGELGLDGEFEDDEMQLILEGLTYHLQHYKYNLLNSSGSGSAYYCSNNFTIH